MSTPEEPPPNIPAGEPSTSAPAAADAVADDADERVRLAKANEAAWLQVAALAEEVNDPQKASDAYEHVLKHNDRNVHALLQLARSASRTLSITCRRCWRLTARRARCTARSATAT